MHPHSPNRKHVNRKEEADALAIFIHRNWLFLSDPEWLFQPGANTTPVPSSEYPKRSNNRTLFIARKTVKANLNNFVFFTHISKNRVFSNQ